MSETVGSGTGILLDERHGLRKPHCVLVLCPEVEGKIVIGNITSVYDHTPVSWKEVTLESGDHPSVIHQSCFPMRFLVVIPMARLVAHTKVENTSVFSKMDIMLHVRILDKLMTSSDCPPDVFKFITENFGAKKFEVIKACVMDPPPACGAE